MTIKVAKTKQPLLNRFGARKYTRVVSSSNVDVFYDIVKVRIKGSRNYKYFCTCPDFIFRQKACKHIRQFKKEEQRIADKHKEK